MSESPAAEAAAATLQSETGLMRRGNTGIDSLDSSSHHHIVSTENSVVSSSSNETGLNIKKLSSGASTATTVSASSSGISNVTDERKEEIDGVEKLPVPQDDKSRTPIVLQMNAPPHPVAEFLFQLTKMLTDDNKEYIEWRKGSIFVTDPTGLEQYILPKYFRHSNYSSFQRQMNYFGFRKIAGKGKMAPCSYVNENAKEDISSLLFIKRKKTGVSSKAATVVAQHSMNPTGGMNPFMMSGPGLMGGFMSLNGLQGMGRGMNHQMMPSRVSNSSFNEASLYREQQQMLAQLQHAHASASSDKVLTGAPPSGLGGQPKANNSFGSNFYSSELQTTDQGNVYNNSSSSNADWSTQYPSSLDTQTHQMRANAGSGMGIDSSANLRALLNQQISFFNNADSSALPVGAAGAMPQNINQGLPMPTRHDKELPQSSSLFNDQATAPAVNNSADNEALIRQLEQQLFEAQTMNGMGGLMGIPRGGSGN